MKALGFIETKGLVGNIDATDAMLKVKKQAVRLFSILSPFMFT